MQTIGAINLEVLGNGRRNYMTFARNEDKTIGYGWVVFNEVSRSNYPDIVKTINKELCKLEGLST